MAFFNNTLEALHRLFQIGETTTPGRTEVQPGLPAVEFGEEIGGEDEGKGDKDGDEGGGGDEDEDEEDEAAENPDSLEELEEEEVKEEEAKEEEMTLFIQEDGEILR